MYSKRFGFHLSASKNTGRGRRGAEHQSKGGDGGVSETGHGCRHNAERWGEWAWFARMERLGGSSGGGGDGGSDIETFGDNAIRRLFGFRGASKVSSCTLCRFLGCHVASMLGMKAVLRDERGCMQGDREIIITSESCACLLRFMCGDWWMIAKPLGTQVG